MTILLQHSKNQPSNSSTNLAIDEKLHQIFYVKPEPLTEEMLAEFEDTKISLDESELGVFFNLYNENVNSYFHLNEQFSDLMQQNLCGRRTIHST